MNPMQPIPCDRLHRRGSDNGTIIITNQSVGFFVPRKGLMAKIRGKKVKLIGFLSNTMITGISTTEAKGLLCLKTRSPKDSWLLSIPGRSVNELAEQIKTYVNEFCAPPISVNTSVMQPSDIIPQSREIAVARYRYQSKHPPRTLTAKKSATVVRFDEKRVTPDNAMEMEEIEEVESVVSESNITDGNLSSDEDEIVVEEAVEEENYENTPPDVPDLNPGPVPGRSAERKGSSRSKSRRRKKRKSGVDFRTLNMLYDAMKVQSKETEARTVSIVDEAILFHSNSRDRLSSSRRSSSRTKLSASQLSNYEYRPLSRKASRNSSYTSASPRSSAHTTSHHSSVDYVNINV
eukprot:TRINITY_DN2407_c3_g1_i1.p1 TRINITY_DN2407_c3_g1~~TRINITY_DN2407_c3_g1_i1.p1  ORF type:complete len:348 (+),score=41.65 TRINITY_DN2407_c3_g1_i1:72-1115(+)